MRFVLVTLLFIASSAYASVPAPVAACQDAIDNFEDNPEQALDDARWCVEQLEQLQQDKQAEQFRDEVAGYTRGSVDQQKMMGMTSIIATYTGDGKAIKVTRMGAADGANPLSALANLAQYGGGRKIRIDGNTGSLMDQNGKVTLTLTLKEGGTMMFESSNAAASDVQAFATAFLTT